jgi:RHH-type proline utilization regulon transcriptional repressor/proline dehydrogenase/delta 1-pyrroline-5-carboxylate dehydrogenase
MTNLEQLRITIRKQHITNEETVLSNLIDQAKLPASLLAEASSKGADLVRAVRGDDKPGLMEVFLAEYGLSTDEGVALMCLAEALLRVPDSETIDDLIEDKIAPSRWGEHLGKSSSSLVNAATWGLMLTGKVLDESASNAISSTLRGAVKRVGEPVIRVAVKRAMKEMGNQFVLGETIESAVKRGAKRVAQGYTYSYDMLGEAALTGADALSFFQSYQGAIEELAKGAIHGDIRDNPGISIKLSALHPRYETTQRERVMQELVPRTLELALQAKAANMGLNIDAEEADRLDLSLDVIEAVLQDPRLAGWDGFGVVVQAYGKRASAVIEWLYTLAEHYDRKIMVRLVKGAYWDFEIKRAQVEGLNSFPVFTRKSATDVSYICCAQQLLASTDRIYPQFATHNAHSVAAIMALSQPHNRAVSSANPALSSANLAYEFQCLHGMGESLYKHITASSKSRCRIYAPVGEHRDLLAYLVRRLLENGANSSFVNQVVDEDVSPEEIAADPLVTWRTELDEKPSPISKPIDLYSPERGNSQGWDLMDVDDINKFNRARAPFKQTKWHASSLLAHAHIGQAPITIRNPNNPQEQVGSVAEASLADVEGAIVAASTWSFVSAAERARVLNKAADLYEKNHGELFAVLTREAGKSPLDAVGELREAVDFLRYYASQIDTLGDRPPRGIFACISPWNFPLAIFTGQIVAALAAGNGVLAKPADPTPIVAFLAVKLLHKAGVPRSVLQLLPGSGRSIGAALAGDSRLHGICFTGSTNTGLKINKSQAANASASAPLIAETGGLNAMIVDSTALPERAVSDIVTSAFQSAGQRCSALRLLYLQEDIADNFLTMLYGAMDELKVGDPWQLDTDVGPLISDDARGDIQTYIDNAEQQLRLLKKVAIPSNGYFIAPTVIKVGGINDMAKEIFGPVLHVATFKASEIDRLVEDINASGYGLTFGLHTRIDDRVEKITSRLNVGNMYVNRNQIGAVVGTQPFGGENLSGTGPKAGGPHYLKRFVSGDQPQPTDAVTGPDISIAVLQSTIDGLSDQRQEVSSSYLPGPTGESNKLSVFSIGRVLCLGPTAELAHDQAVAAQSVGCQTLVVCPGASGEHSIDGFLPRAMLSDISGIAAVTCTSDAGDLSEIRKALAARKGALVPLVTEKNIAERCVIERHLCIDTTAAGGNVALLASMG